MCHCHKNNASFDANEIQECHQECSKNACQHDTCQWKQQNVQTCCTCNEMCRCWNNTYEKKQAHRILQRFQEEHKMHRPITPKPNEQEWATLMQRQMNKNKDDDEQASSSTERRRSVKINAKRNDSNQIWQALHGYEEQENKLQKDCQCGRKCMNICECCRRCEKRETKPAQQETQSKQEAKAKNESGQEEAWNRASYVENDKDKMMTDALQKPNASTPVGSAGGKRGAEGKTGSENAGSAAATVLFKGKALAKSAKMLANAAKRTQNAPRMTLAEKRAIEARRQRRLNDAREYELSKKPPFVDYGFANIAPPADDQYMLTFNTKADSEANMAARRVRMFGVNDVHQTYESARLYANQRKQERETRYASVTADPPLNVLQDETIQQQRLRRGDFMENSQYPQEHANAVQSRPSTAMINQPQQRPGKLSAPQSDAGMPSPRPQGIDNNFFRPKDNLTYNARPVENLFPTAAESERPSKRIEFGYATERYKPIHSDFKPIRATVWA